MTASRLDLLAALESLNRIADQDELNLRFQIRFGDPDARSYTMLDEIDLRKGVTVSRALGKNFAEAQCVLYGMVYGIAAVRRSRRISTLGRDRQRPTLPSAEQVRNLSSADATKLVRRMNDPDARSNTRAGTGQE